MSDIRETGGLLVALAVTLGLLTFAVLGPGHLAPHAAYNQSGPQRCFYAVTLNQLYGAQEVPCNGPVPPFDPRHAKFFCLDRRGHPTHRAPGNDLARCPN
jgi:hypothetical protein